MSTEAIQPGPSFQVVVNDRGQYSLWPLGRALPAGWSAAPMTGTREACLSYVEEVWTDLRPRPAPVPSERS